MVKIKREPESQYRHARWDRISIISDNAVRVFSIPVKNNLIWEFEALIECYPVLVKTYEKTNGRPRLVEQERVPLERLARELEEIELVVNEQKELSKLLKGKSRARPKAARL